MPAWHRSRRPVAFLQRVASLHRLNYSIAFFPPFKKKKAQMSEQWAEACGGCSGVVWEQVSAVRLEFCPIAGDRQSLPAWPRRCAEKEARLHGVPWSAAAASPRPACCCAAQQGSPRVSASTSAVCRKAFQRAAHLKGTAPRREHRGACAPLRVGAGVCLPAREPRQCPPPGEGRIANSVPRSRRAYAPGGLIRDVTGHRAAGHSPGHVCQPLDTQARAPSSVLSHRASGPAGAKVRAGPQASFLRACQESLVAHQLLLSRPAAGYTSHLCSHHAF